MNKKSKAAISQVGATEFKAHCLELLTQVQTTQREVVVTKRGKPFVRIVPVRQEKPQLFGFLKGQMKIVGDITGPIEADWNAMKD